MTISKLEIFALVFIVEFAAFLIWGADWAA
jgi:hypothetical protein